METPSGPAIRTLFIDERATSDVLTFLRETKVGEVFSLAVLGWEGEGDT